MLSVRRKKEKDQIVQKSFQSSSEKNWGIPSAVSEKEEYMQQITNFFNDFFNSEKVMDNKCIKLISEYAVQPKMKIIHIKQTHEGCTLEPAFVTEPREMEITVQSQFQVAQELRKYVECPIVVEGNYKDEQDAKSQPLATIAKKIFPEGFPSNYNNLTKLQKEFLYDQGGARTLFYLGEISAIYKCTRHDELADNKEFFKRFMNSIKRHLADEKRERVHLSDRLKNILAFKTLDLQEYVYDSREKEAIECAKEAAIQHFKKLEDAKVIIVFGAAHNFKPHCDKERFEYEEIDASKMQKQIEKIEISSNQSGFFTQLRKQFDETLTAREIRKELQSLLKKGLYY